MFLLQLTPLTTWTWGSNCQNWSYYHMHGLHTSQYQHKFLTCLSQHCIPEQWKIHLIAPVHKSGDKSAVTNYRPISLLCSISKVTRKINIQPSDRFHLHQHLRQSIWLPSQPFYIAAVAVISQWNSQFTLPSWGNLSRLQKGFWFRCSSWASPQVMELRYNRKCLYWPKKLSD